MEILCKSPSKLTLPRFLEVRLIPSAGESVVDIFAENIFLTGSIPALQNWSPDTALALSAAGYPTWSSEYLIVPLVRI